MRQRIWRRNTPRPFVLGGIDEAGRGPVFGPMVVAGISGPDHYCFRALGVRDSKVLPALRREKILADLERVAHAIEVRTFSAQEIDRRRRRETMNEIEVAAFADIARSLGAPQVFVDAADVDAARFGRLVTRRLGTKRGTVSIVASHKADALYPSVSAASIVAKVLRDEAIRELATPLEEQLGRPLGSGYTHDPITIRFLEAWQEEYGTLPPGTRGSWFTAKAILEKRANRSLAEFAPTALST